MISFAQIQAIGLFLFIHSTHTKLFHKLLLLFEIWLILFGDYVKVVKHSKRKRIGMLCKSNVLKEWKCLMLWL